MKFDIEYLAGLLIGFGIGGLLHIVSPATYNSAAGLVIFGAVLYGYFKWYRPYLRSKRTKK